MDWITSLADAIPGEVPPGMESWFRNLMYVVGFVFFLMAGESKRRELFGRKPPIDQELKERQIHAEQQRAELHAKVDEVLNEVRAGQEKEKEARQQDRIQIYNRINQTTKELADKIEKNAHELSNKIDTSRESTNEEFRDVAVKVGKLEQLTTTHTQQLTHVESTQNVILQRLPRKA